MTPDNLQALLQNVQEGKTSIEEAMQLLKHLPFENLGYARVDHHRNLRNGFPEVIYCAGKTVEQVQGIARSLLQNGSNLLATRASEEVFYAIKAIPADAVYYPLARVVIVEQKRPAAISGTILVISAGTSDLPVAEEAAVTAEALGNRVERLYDAGVAGIHRLLSSLESLERARVIIAVAGMEGALASVVGGLVDKPVIAVPTSVGYGASFGGVAALLAMLNSCASGISVVNIDNGFGAGYLASLINRQVDRAIQLADSKNPQRG